MADKADDAQGRAEASFKKAEQRSRESDFAKAEQKAMAAAVDQKTARLKAQRLEKEAAEQATTAASRPSGGKARGGQRKRSPRLVADPDEVKGG
jgi:hypothetical protein